LGRGRPVKGGTGEEEQGDREGGGVRKRPRVQGGGGTQRHWRVLVGWPVARLGRMQGPLGGHTPWGWKEMSGTGGRVPGREVGMAGRGVCDNQEGMGMGPTGSSMGRGSGGASWRLVGQNSRQGQSQ